MALFFQSSASALEWEQKEITVKLEPGQRVATAEFKYKNTTAEPVEIKQVKPTCDCVAAVVGQTTIKPGESGSIQATYRTGDRVGEQHQSIRITTNEKTSGLTTLKLNVNIPEVLLLEPATLTWNKDEPREPKVVKITQFIKDDQAPTVKNSNPAFQTELKRDQAISTLVVSPPKEGDASAALIKITVNQSIGKPKSKILRCDVK